MFRAIERRGTVSIKDLREILRSTRKTRKQLELLEDAVVIYKEGRLVGASGKEPTYRIEESLYNPQSMPDDIYHPVK